MKFIQKDNENKKAEERIVLIDKKMLDFIDYIILRGVEEVSIEFNQEKMDRAILILKEESEFERGFTSLELEDFGKDVNYK